MKMSKETNKQQQQASKQPKWGTLEKRIKMMKNFLSQDLCLMKINEFFRSGFFFTNKYNTIRSKKKKKKRQTIQATSSWSIFLTKAKIHKIYTENF